MFRGSTNSIRKGHDPAGHCMTSQFQIIKKPRFELDTRPHRAKPQSSRKMDRHLKVEIISTGRKWIEAFYSGGTGPAVLI